MTSSVISICGLAIAFSRGSAKNGFSVPKASECSRTETRDSGGSPPQVFWIAATTSARFSSSAALTLKNSARRPGGADLAGDPVGVGLRGLAVEVDAEDVPARLRERERARLPETGGSAQDEGPAGARSARQSGGNLSTAEGTLRKRSMQRAEPDRAGRSSGSSSRPSCCSRRSPGSSPRARASPSPTKPATPRSRARCSRRGTSSCRA